LPKKLIDFPFANWGNDRLGLTIGIKNRSGPVAGLATGTLVQLELEAMGLKSQNRALPFNMVDHNLLQTEF